MRLSAFHYDLPEELIAQRPTAERTASRLLCLDGPSGVVTDRRFTDFKELLNPGDLLVINDSRVIPARLYGRKDSGGRVEVLIERIVADTTALAHVRASKSPAVGGLLHLEGDTSARVTARRESLFELEFDRTVLPHLERFGHMPLPPYIRRDDDPSDRERYQTVYAERPGAVAAPTAGLHLTRDLLDELAELGIPVARVTLHVGAGTFQPVRTDTVEEHRMHSEYFEVGEDVCDLVAATRRAGGRVIAVGTTSVRALESAASGEGLRPLSGETDIYIYPGYTFRVVDALLTNFHLPESTLLMLVSAFAGYDKVMNAYRHAVGKRYRFFSYGDAMFMTRGEGTAP